MASITYRVTGLDAMEKAFAKAAKGPSEHAIARFERTLDRAFRAVRTATHVETGKLRLSGRATSHHFKNIWVGDITFVRRPGIFELARGNTPTKYHPEGGHFFFNAVEPFFPMFDENMDAVFRDFFEDNAPL